MDMGPADILMPIDDIGLVAISHFLHVFLTDDGQLFIAQHIVRVWIKRDVNNRFLSPAIGCQVRLKGTDAVPDSRIAVCRFHDPVSCQWPCLLLVHFFLIVV